MENDKQKVRAALKKERAAISFQARNTWDYKIAWHLENWSCLRKAERIMVYLSFSWEINTWPVAKRLWKEGKKVFVPLIQKNTRTLVPASYTSKTALTSKDFGIKEPLDPLLADPSSLDVVLVPGLAFSPDGYRIGFGGGYYDRFLPTTPALRVGLCYSEFLRELTRDSWDQPVHFLATERGITRV